MCGGRGTRLATATEKPLVRVGGRATIDRVLDALVAAPVVDTVVAAVSPHTPATRAHLRERGPPPTVVETAGEGYVADLDDALAAVSRPAVTLAADLPLVDADAVTDVIEAYRAVAGDTDTVGDSEASDGDADGRGDASDGDRETPAPSLSVCVPAARVEALGGTLDTTFTPADRELAPTGVNVVGDPDGPERRLVCADDRLAVNVNRSRDWRVAERLLEAR